MKSLNDLKPADWLFKYEDIILFAKTQHKGQKRKGSDDDYFTHLTEVSYLLGLITNDRDLIAGGVLHDVVEDVEGIENSDVAELAGESVAKLVEEATNVSKLKEGNRAFRREADALRLLTISNRGKTLKLADCIHNLTSDQLDDDFTKLYYSEKRNLLLSLYGGDKTLFKALVIVITHYYTTGTIYSYQKIIESIRTEGILNWNK